MVLYFLAPIIIMLLLGVNGAKSRSKLKNSTVVILAIIFGFISFFYTLKLKNALLLVGAGIVVSIITGGMGYILGIIVAIFVNIGAASEHNACFE